MATVAQKKTTSSVVSTQQRFTRRNPCPVCQGFKELPKGHGKRCYGFLGADGKYAHCTRPEYAHDLFKQVIAGRIEPKIGTAAATIARTLLELHTANTLERRLDELEQSAGLRRVS